MTRHDRGTLSFERKLPNGIHFGTKVLSSREAVHMEMWLSNHSDRPLTDLRVQNCLMLKGAAGFQRQIGDNKILSKPYVAAPCEPTADRWVITAWEPNDAVWTILRARASIPIQSFPIVCPVKLNDCGDGCHSTRAAIFMVK